MLVTKTITVTQEAPLVATCNKCEKSINVELGFLDVHSFCITGGYSDTFPEDGEKISFELCGKCLKEFVETFKIKPDMIDTIGWN